MTPLVYTPAPYPTESLWGYVLRVAEENGYDSPSSVLGLAGLNTVRGKASRFDPCALAPILCRPAEELAHLSYSVASTDEQAPFQILGKPAGASYRHSLLNLRGPAFCPQCVAETGFLDAFWDIRYVVACPKHHCALLRNCSACGDTISWNRRALLTCQCGHDLRNETTAPVASEVTELMEVLLRKLHGKSLAGLENRSKYPLEEFEGIELWPIVMMCRALAHSAGFKTQGARDSTPEQVITFAADALSNWPHNYHAMLHRVGTEVGTVPLYKAGLNARFQKFHDSMFKLLPYASHYDFLRREYLRFGCEEWGESTVDKRALDGVDCDRRYVSQSELAKQLGVTRATVTAWTKQGLLTLKKVETGKAKRYIANTTEVLIPRRAPGKTLALRDAAASVGLPQNVLLELRQLGIFQVRYLASRKAAFHEKDIEHFRGQLLESAPSLEADTSQTLNDAVTLFKIMNRAKFFPAVERAHFIGKYLEGALKSLGRSTDRVQDILFDAKTVRDFILQHKAIGLSYADAARLLGCKEAAVPKLVGDGFLEQVTVGKPRPRVTQASVTQFKSTHVFLSAVAEELSTSLSRLIRLASKAQIEYLRAGGDWKAKGGSPFVRRADVARLKAEAMRTESWAARVKNHKGETS